MNAKLNYRPRSELEKVGTKIYNLLVDNFPQTFYVGGMVRDLLLKRPITDIDIATKATPDQVIKILEQAGIKFEARNKQFGVIIAAEHNLSIEITTFRKDYYGKSRYPKISFVNTAKQDSKRRDFTINALYLSAKSAKILDYHKGLADLKTNQLKFIGNPIVRIKQDPLRVIRAVRFSKTHNLKLNVQTENAIKKYLNLIGTLTATRIKNELNKIKNIKKRNSVLREIDNKNLLDIK